MITRAQAEALLTLAESLEACEQVGVTLSTYHGKPIILQGADCIALIDRINGMEIRLAVNALIPKSEG